MVRIGDPDALRQPVKPSDNRQGAQCMNGNGAPRVHLGRIGGERAVNRQAAKDV